MTERKYSEEYMKEYIENSGYIILENKYLKVQNL